MITFIVGIVGNILASYIYDTMRSQDAKSPPLVLILNSDTVPTPGRSSPSPTFDHRALNRGRLQRGLALLFFFVVTFYILWFALYFASFWGPGALSANQMYELGQIKFIGWFTDASVPWSSVQTFIIIAAALLYLPTLLLGDRLLVIIKGWYDKFWPVTFEKWIMLRGATFLVLSLFLSGVVLFMVTDLPIGWALALPFIVVIGLLLYAASNPSS